MKCPKCGYHSFDYLTNCRKCNSDLTTFKNKYRLRSLIFPHRLNSAMAQSEPEASRFVSPTPTPASKTATDSIDFGFDFMAEETTPAQSKKPQPARPTPEQPSPQATVAIQPELPESVFAGENETIRDALPMEEEPFEESDPDDTFGLDFSWDTDLPALDEGQFIEEERSETIGTDNSSEWNFEEKSPARERKSGQLDVGEEPRHPFELRGSGANRPAPVSFPKRTTALPQTIEDNISFTIENSRATPVEAPLPTLATGTPSLLPRSLALGIDLLILIIATLFFLAAGEIALAPDSPQRLLPTPEEILSRAIPYFLVFFSVCFGYFTLFHFLIGQTLGKILLHLRVETESGRPLLFSQAFLRSVGGLFSLLLFGFGFFALLFDSHRRGWNDRLAGTLVVTTNTEAPKQPESAGQ